MTNPNFPERYIIRYCDELTLSRVVVVTALKICRAISETLVISGKTPSAIAGACIYIACQMHEEPRTQRRIEEITGFSEATIRKRYSEIINELCFQVFMVGG